ncbi:hypothetical protein [Nonomuraea jiangxiensis]|uniref:Uncharacterized protein n=1 Tax=Nonomuraea jiangxiensis TaxID=633440 RepID=A0A1G9BCF8_9ACTN|nr:hypothetical protein [Nonomuraea jiangxiensis]SDK37228.1 hypothetical protein SAMN05421869_115222 [Nonomuraea jiangxiensis]
MGDELDPFTIQSRDEVNKRRFTRMFGDPDQAARLLAEAAEQDRAPLGVSSILLDRASVDYAWGYFGGNAKPPRLTLPAVAEFVNAAVLYDHVLTGPEGSRSERFTRGPDGSWIEQPLWKGAGEVVEEIDGHLSWAEIFSVLAVAKGPALEGLEVTVPGVEQLLDAPLDQRKVAGRLAAITPRAAMLSPHKLYDLVDRDDHYYSDFSLGTLGPTKAALDTVDPELAGTSPRNRHWDVYAYRDGESFPEQDTGEHFAAHLVYRTHVYLLFADLLGCPYSADAVRGELVSRLDGPRRGFAERVVDLVGQAEQAKDEQVNAFLGSPAFRVRIPLVLKHVLSRARTREEVLQITMDTRDSREARRFRRYARNVDEAIAEGRREDVVRACAELTAYGVTFDAGLAERSPRSSAGTVMTDVAKELVSVGSPLLGALVPGVALASGRLRHRFGRRRFAFVERLTRLPRNLNALEREFSGLWPHP